MEIYVSRQALALALALLMGVLIGLLYDLLRPVRRRGGKFCAAVLDCLFSLCSAFAAFLYAMTAPSGRLGLWELFMTLLGFTLYMYTLSDSVFHLLDGLLSRVCDLTGYIYTKIKKFVNSPKFNFHIVRK